MTRQERARARARSLLPRRGGRLRAERAVVACRFYSSDKAGARHFPNKGSAEKEASGVRFRRVRERERERG